MINILEDFKGKTATKNILDDAAKILLENKSKCLGFTPRPNIVSLVHIEKPNETEILQIGGSKPYDLMNQNFLNMMARFIRPVASNFQSVDTMPKNTAGNLVSNIHIYDQFFTLSGGGDRQMFTSSGGCTIQVGAGAGAATRTEFGIDTPFGTAPESGPVGIVASQYNTVLNRCEFNISFGAVGSGTILETCLFSGYRNGTFLMSRDNIPSTPFDPGEIVFVNYILAL